MMVFLLQHNGKLHLRPMLDMPDLHLACGSVPIHIMVHVLEILL